MKITYIFVTGRIERLEKISNFAKEMFYGYDYFSEKYPTNIIELHDNKNLVNKFLRIIDKIINKITLLPFNMNNIFSIKNFKIIYNSNQIIVSNDRLALSALPMFIIAKFFRKKIKISFFVMGLFVHKKRNFLQSFFHYILLKLLFKTTNNVIFLGIEEYEFACREYPKFIKKFNYLPFMVDVKFWKAEKLGTPKDGILFVGNDSNREFEKVLKIASILKDINFTIVSKYYRINKIEVNLENVKIIDGSWGNQKITDQELAKLYTKSKLVIIPLIESSQPSGQSVTLQSMSLKTPVMITKTIGFWDKIHFGHLDNIYFIENNSLDNWIRSINETYYDENLLSILAQNGYKLINKHYTNITFYKKLEKILNI
tara:strand:- start:566 stop:1678 length:1113 start_codon:yes stop_codon:yes gene_type:complete